MRLHPVPERGKHAGAAPLCGKAARNAVAAELEETPVPLDAVSGEERFHAGGGLCHQESAFIASEAARNLRHVAGEEFGSVLDAFFLLKRRADAGKVETGHERRAAGEGHFLEHQDFGAFFSCGNGGNRPGDARADHDHVDFFIPFAVGRRGVRGLRGKRRESGGAESGSGGTGKKLAAGLRVHFFVSF